MDDDDGHRRRTDAGPWVTISSGELKSIFEVVLDFDLKPHPQGMDLLVRCHRVLLNLRLRDSQ